MISELKETLRMKYLKCETPGVGIPDGYRIPDVGHPEKVKRQRVQDF